MTQKFVVFVEVDVLATVPNLMLQNLETTVFQFKGKCVDSGISEL